MNIVWRCRLAIARWLLGKGPDGYDYYFHRQTLYTRSQRASTASVDELRALGL